MEGDIINPMELEQEVLPTSFSETDIVTTKASPFKPLSAQDLWSGKSQYRKIQIPPHRLTPLKQNWLKIYTPIVEHMKLQIKMNLKARCIELRTSALTVDPAALQKAADFVKAFSLGFDIGDSIALLRLDELYIDSFEVRDVKSVLHGDHLSRAIGRVAGRSGRTKIAIENATKTRIVIADSHIHILGSFQNIRLAKDAICSLILGSPPGKVYAQLRTVAARMHERF